jgi:hypothetical protein
MNEPKRRTLRQRVADRKRGIKREQPLSASQKRKLKFVTLAFVVVQYVGLMLLLIGLKDFVADGFVIRNVNLFAISCGMFLIGRVGPLVIKTLNVFK